MKFRAAAVVAALAIALTGCGSQTDDPTDPLSHSVQELTAAEFGTAMSQAQLTAKSAHLEGTITKTGSPKVKMRGDMSVGSSLADFQMQMTMTLGPGKNISMSMVKGVMYMKAPHGLLTHNAARPWLRVDLNDPSNPLGSMFQSLYSNLDPEHVAKMYASITKLSNLGVDTVNGVPARHYTVTVDAKKVIKAMGMDKIPGVSMAQLLKAMPATVSSQVWLDDQQRPVKMRSDLKGTSTEITYTDWGKTVHVKAPPANQVTDFPGLGSGH